MDTQTRLQNLPIGIQDFEKLKKHDYNPEFGSYTFGFPNAEVEKGFLDFLMPVYANTRNIKGVEIEVQCYF